MMSSASLEELKADIEIIESAFMEEVERISTTDSFPFSLRLKLSTTAFLELEYTDGYPDTTITVTRYRSSQRDEYRRLEHVVEVVKETANENCGTVASLLVCSAALEAWNDYEDAEGGGDDDDEECIAQEDHSCAHAENLYKIYAGEPLIDRKSTFQSFVIPIQEESDVPRAMNQLITGHPKIKRATHNMVS